jgi:hypothetical protein
LAAPPIPEEGVYGDTYAPDPLDGCSEFASEVVDKIAFAVVQRGGDCTFETKVRNSQNAGFTATIVYDNVDEELVKSKLPFCLITYLMRLDQNSVVLCTSLAGPGASFFLVLGANYH